MKGGEGRTLRYYFIRNYFIGLFRNVVVLQLGDRDGGGVGSEDGMRRGDSGQVLEDLALQIEVFRHRLHHEIHRAQILQRPRRAEAF